MDKLKSFIREARSELKKITWPGKKELWYSTVIVIFVTLIIAAYLGLLDLILTGIFSRIVG